MHQSSLSFLFSSSFSPPPNPWNTDFELSVLQHSQESLEEYWKLAAQTELLSITK